MLEFGMLEKLGLHFDLSKIFFVHLQTPKCSLYAFFIDMC